MGEANYRGDAKFYYLDFPTVYTDEERAEHLTDYIMISSGVFGMGPLTFAFPCNMTGKVLDWFELRGSVEGTLDHETVLNNMGYKLI